MSSSSKMDRMDVMENMELWITAVRYLVIWFVECILNRKGISSPGEKRIKVNIVINVVEKNNNY